MVKRLLCRLGIHPYEYGDTTLLYSVMRCADCDTVTSSRQDAEYVARIERIMADAPAHLTSGERLEWTLARLGYEV